MPPAPTSVSTAVSQTKPSRPRESLDPPRQVHLTSEGTKIPINTRGPPNISDEKSPRQDQPNSTSTGAARDRKPVQQTRTRESEASSRGHEQQESTQPQAFPGIGHFPGAGQPGLQWYRSGIPGQSLSSGCLAAGGHLPTGHNTLAGPTGLLQQQNHGCHPLLSPQHQSPFPVPPNPTSTTFIGRQHFQNSPVSMTGDYQNTAPPNRGQCYQPPVPDTTFGPMYHVYTPRFDPPGVMPPAPVGHQAPPVAPVPMCQYFMPQQQQPYTGHAMTAHPPVMYAQHPQMTQQYQPMPLAAQPGGIMGPPGGGPPTVIPIMAGNPGPNVSEVAGVGRTPMEEAVRQHHFAHANKLFEPQDFKPADDDPSRFYYVREVDGNWTQRNRFTIESTGDCRWFVTPEGWFYAVRQPD